MNKRPAIIASFFCLALVLSLVITGCSSSSSSNSQSPTPTIDAAAAQAILQGTCSHCHALDRVTSKIKTAEQWKITVDRMISKGVQLTPDQEQNLVDYLAATY